MSLRSEQIPNRSLNGREVLEIAVQQFREMLERDCVFLPTIAYRKVAISFQATFHLGYPHPEHTVRSRTKTTDVVEGEAPLKEEPEEGVLTSLERDVSLENPNIARVAHDLPIKLQERAPQKALANTSGIPGEPVEMLQSFPEFVTKELRYDKADYPGITPPMDRDVSERKAKELGVKKAIPAAQATPTAGGKK